MREYKNAFFSPKVALQLLIICTVIIAPTYLSRDLYTPLILIIGFLIFIFSLKKIKRSYIILVWPLLSVFLIGISGSLDHELRDVMRDIVYALFPPVLIFMGFWIRGNKKVWPYFFKTLAVCACVLTIIHLSKFFINPYLLSQEVYFIRKEAGGISTLSVLVIVLALLQKKLGISSVFPKIAPRFVFLPLLLVSLVLSFSRTHFLLAIVFIFALFGFLNQIKLKTIFVALLTIVSIAVFVATTPDVEEGTFHSKIVKSLDEVTIADHYDMEDINDNWRGFESYRAIKSFSSGSLLDQMLGQGFGALVDLGFYMELAGERLRYIPILHNGYIYILIKTGLLGLTCYFIFYIRILKYAVLYCKSENDNQAFLAKLLLGCVVSLIFTMFVIGGMAEGSEPALIMLIGYLVQGVESAKADLLINYAKNDL